LKIMRYRIRIITLVLVCALLAVALWTAKSAWYPDGIRPDTPEEAVQPVASEVSSSSPSGQDPWADPVDPAPAAETVPSPEETPASDPLFNTFGL
jgi:hypothetical protein